ncbi:hypothetical protein E2C01_086827 [Portunus trituberculatus]|uniref:Uncharacterized protein n=1 Tax=Portunus trituberculatus TaxID=210409 RepID=A0A5B7JAC4_PORTR|nr:hypothetical protein [Portunus trituberculatus]
MSGLRASCSPVGSTCHSDRPMQVECGCRGPVMPLQTAKLRQSPYRPPWAVTTQAVDTHY